MLKITTFKLVFTTPTFINLSLPNPFLANPLFKRYNEYRLLKGNKFQNLFHFNLFQLSFTVLINFRYVIMFNFRCVEHLSSNISTLTKFYNLQDCYLLKFSSCHINIYSFRFRSPLLTESRLIFPLSTKMFQFLKDPLLIVFAYSTSIYSLSSTDFSY